MGSRTIAIVFGLVALAGQASADNLNTSDASGTATNWEGVYVGVTGGYGWGDAYHECCSGAARSDDFDIDGITIGGTLGYNYEYLNDWVLGIETDLSFAALDGSIPSMPGTFTCGTGPALRCDSEVEWFGTLRGRVGWKLHQSLLFATAGLAYGGVYGAIPDAAGFGLGGSTSTAMGWTAGGGVEWAINDDWSVKGEALYVDLNSVDYGVFTITGDSYQTEAHFTSARIGINRRFGGRSR